MSTQDSRGVLRVEWALTTKSSKIPAGTLPVVLTSWWFLKVPVVRGRFDLVRGGYAVSR
ncbi:hypothetical protein Kfla_5301 [Kribbella flavida DSM 17836]|uniref:Uncharacterized protein n=1 Tax=Kribbella flavida (strain DSM 17836 / JCM 10339 / NBRC 14399) TaxID=479435 RepID=D2PL60_KRIFD|nr:hypothetical protein Kfla_5301 [Kribbella flavida DSM 17836]